MSERAARKPKVPLILLALAAIAFLTWFLFFRNPATATGVIQVSGRIESDDAAIAAKTAGRVREITVREGDQVKAGQVIATLDDDQVKAREEQARATVSQAEARVMRTQQQVGVLQAQLDQARLAVEQARLDAQGRVQQAEEQIAAAEAQLAQARASYDQARYDEERFARLVQTGDVPERTGKQAQTTAKAQAAVVQAAQKQVEVARGALTTARANLANPAIRSEQAAAVQQQIVQARSDIEAAQADADRARAQLQEAQANRNDLIITAPFDATVATRAAEPGEVLAPGSPIVTLVNLNAVYLRAFVPEGDIGRVRVGQPARVYLDSAPNQPLEAVISRIDPQASFTPENVYFRDDRVKQVFGVKLQLKDPQGFAKPGMPADGAILVEGEVWPAQPRR